MQPSKHQGRVPILLTSAEVLEACEEGYKQFAETMRNSRREAWTYTIPGNQRCCGYTDGDFASAERTPEETRSTRDMPTVYEISAAIPRWPTLYADVSTSIQVMLLDEGIQPHKHTPKNLTLQFSLHYHADKLQKCLRKAAISP